MKRRVLTGCPSLIGGWRPVCALLVVVGCGRLAVAPVVPSAGAIEGTAWQLTRVGGLAPEALAASSKPPTMRLEQGRLQGFGGCNRLSGNYSVDGDRLTVGALAGTMMICDESVMAVETAFAKALGGVLRIRVADGKLTLAPEAGSESLLEFTAAAPQQLEDIVWEVTGYNNGRSAVVSPKLGTTLTVRFDAGSLTGHAGCNRFRATYTLDGARLQVDSAVATTRKHCEDEVMQQESEFLAAVRSAVVWAIDFGMLDMHRADGERVLTATPMSEL